MQINLEDLSRARRTEKVCLVVLLTVEQNRMGWRPCIHIIRAAPPSSTGERMTALSTALSFEQAVLDLQAHLSEWLEPDTLENLNGIVI